jgi:hypothetical protein
MRTALLATLILLLPAALLAGPTVGVYFTFAPNQMTYNPTPFEQFNGYVFAQNSGCILNGAEFALDLPAGLMVLNTTFPAGALNIGALPAGISIAYWPPMDGFNPGYNLLCTVQFLATAWCWNEGSTLHDAALRVIPDVTGHIYGSCWPEGSLFDYAGLTSILCPDQIAVKDKSWGAIKSLF